MRIDLHLHSTASDGSLDPTELVARARAGGLDVIALTDHDTVAGVPTALAAAGQDLSVIPGIEISASHEGRELHVLGYFIDPAAPTLLEYTHHAARAREVRMRQMIERLGELGLEVDFDAVLHEAGAGVHSLARPHLARVLCSTGQVGSVFEAFDRFIGDDGPAYVAARLADASGAIRLVHEAGGLAVWAHPPMRILDEMLPALLDAGLDGLECYRPRLPEPDLDRLLRAAHRHDLVTTGGSDWHGDWHGGLGDFHIAPDRLRAFLDAGGL